MTQPRKGVVVKLDHDMHDAFTNIALLEGIDFGKLAERLIQEFVLEDHRKFNLRQRSNAYRRISENFSEKQGKGS